MGPTTQQVIDAARSLPRQARADVVAALIGTLDDADGRDDARGALKEAIRSAVQELEAGDFDEIPVDEIRGYILAQSRAS